MEKNRYRYK